MGGSQPSVPHPNEQELLGDASLGLCAHPRPMPGTLSWSPPGVRPPWVPPGPMSQCLPWAGTSPVSRTAGHKPRTTQGRLQKAGPLGGQPSPPPLTPVHGWGRGQAHLSLSPSLCATSLSLSFSIHG